VTHDEAVNAALLTVSALGHRAWRREVGHFYDPRAVKAALGHLSSGRTWEAGLVLRKASPHKIGVPGEADVQGLLVGGWGLAVEVKTGRAVRNGGQIKWAAMFQAMGGCYVLARWNDTEDGTGQITDAISSYLRSKSQP
jgi:hypothetical protein